mgnify:CR=1 FL=1
MKMIEDMLNNLKIPRLENGDYFNKLRVELMQTFVSPQRIYQMRYHWAVSIAAVLFVLLLLAFTSPGIVAKVNNFAFGGNESVPEQLIVQEQNQIPAEQYSQASTSIVQKSDQNRVTSDKTYMINQYNTPQRGRVMIVSEYNKQPQNNKIRKVSVGCY